MGSPTFMWKTGYPEMANLKRVRTSRPKHSDTSLSREWRINVANNKKYIYIYIFLSLEAAFVCYLVEMLTHCFCV